MDDELVYAPQGMKHHAMPASSCIVFLPIMPELLESLRRTIACTVFCLLTNNKRLLDSNPSHPKVSQAFFLGF